MLNKKMIFHAFSFFAVFAFLFQTTGVVNVKAGHETISSGAGIDATPPTQPVKLIFIHHSTGQNLLQDDYGQLGLALKNNNYFVSDTNYGWGPNAIGDLTDIPNWTEWFRSTDTPTYMNALFNESAQHSTYTRLASNPGGQNKIILFKSCFPNSNLEGNPNDLPSASVGMTVGHAKWVYNQILQYFGQHPNKLFVVLTAPPVQDGTYSTNARAFNQWLMNNWLTSNAYTLKNVAVFDFYNVLTAASHHHRYINGAIEHVFTPGVNTLYYPSGDDHPSIAGSLKATTEFLPLLNIFYHRWQDSVGPSVLSIKRVTTSPTTAVSIKFTVKFSKPVTGVDANDFSLRRTGSTLNNASISPTLTGAGDAYTVSVNTGSGSGTLGLNLIDNDTIMDTTLNKLGGDGPGNGNFTAGEAYLINKGFVSNSIVAHDGWLLESTETSNLASAMNATDPILMLGDNAAKRQYRSVLSFNTSSLPDTAVVTGAVLKVKKQAAIGSGDPLTIFQGIMIDIKTGFFASAATLQLSDFQAVANKTLGPGSPTLVSGFYNINLITGKDAINKLTSNGGLTQIRLRFKLDDNNDAAANYLSLYSGDAVNVADRPQLVVTYYVP